jgi:hypothetical protein
MILQTGGLAAAALLGSASFVSAQTVRAAEYHLKAVFLFHFAQFVDWPAQAVPDSQAPLVIGILGDDPFGGVIEATVSGEHRGTRPFAVRRYPSGEDVAGCDVLFISRSEASRLEEVLAALGNRPILTVSDAGGFAERGGMIQLVTDGAHIRLRINLQAVQSADLTISSKLLRVAEIVSARR